LETYYSSARQFDFRKKIEDLVILGKGNDGEGQKGKETTERREERACVDMDLSAPDAGFVFILVKYT
jgi:hypothetical protein